MTPRSWLTVTAAALSCLTGGVAVVAARGPWFRFTFLGVATDIRGTSSSLEGRYALALGATAVAIGALAVFLGPRHRTAKGSGLLLLVVALAGLAVMHHQDRHLTSAQTALQSSGFGSLNRVFPAVTTPTWGYRLDVAAFAVLAGAALVLLVAARGATASEQPERAAVDRDDAPSQV